MKDETINKTHTQLYIPETTAQVLPQNYAHYVSN